MTYLAWTQRVEGLWLAPTSDEVATVPRVPGLWAIAIHPETAVNPPLWRWISWGSAPLDAIMRGRLISLVMGILAVPLAWRVAWRMVPSSQLGARGLAGMWFASLIAVHPLLVQMSTIDRVYASLVACSLLLMGQLTCAFTRRNLVAISLVSILMCWLHYLAVPLLCGIGVWALLRGVRALSIAVFAGPLSLLVLLPQLVGDSSLRVMAPADTKPLEIVTGWLALGLEMPRMWGSGALGEALQHLVGKDIASSIVLGVVSWLVLVGVMAWRRAVLPLQLVAAAALSLAVSILVIGRVQYVRPVVATLAVAWVGAVLAVVPWHLKFRGLAGGLCLVLTWLTFGALPQRMALAAQQQAAQNGPFHLLSRAQAWQAVRDGGPVIVWPAHKLQVAWLVGTGSALPEGAGDVSSCGGWSPCYLIDGMPYTGLRHASDAARIDGVLVILQASVPEVVRSACVRFDARPGMIAFACGNAVRRLPHS